ncbi:hypothetical protein EDC96DRAFT_515844 [Choanephora cucurbitarum]|nr:hypothetical protein EDC96DRAFT_515844 [Choanephora cucurbitarum]
MKFFTAVSGIVLAASGVAAQLTAPMQNYNVSSPVSNGPYVAGQVLPCTIQLFDTVPTVPQLTISLTSATSSNVSYVISSSVDVSKTSASAKQNGNVTYYEHSVNYNIPSTVTPGTYNVVFLDTLTNTHLDVPINVLPVASTPSASSAAGTGSSAAPTASVFKPSSDVASMAPGLTTKAIVSLAGVAALAYMF